MLLRRKDLPLESDRPVFVDFFDVQVHAARPGEALVARLASEEGEAQNLHSALGPVRREGTHL